uniref:Oxysterol-binding protein n=1 Tax=Parascaris univalens TaxID=6257 RepID=A0A915AZ51_PARUN
MALQDARAPGEQGNSSGKAAKDAVEKGKQRLLRLSKKLKKAPDPVVMEDLSPDAPPVNCPPPLEGYLSMKPYRKRRISVAKRYCAKLVRGLLKLTNGKGQRMSYECLASEYTIDLSNVSVKTDDARKRIIVAYKSEAYQLTPVIRDEYEKWKTNIRKHRLFRQSFRRQRKEEVESEPLETTPLLDIKMPHAQESSSMPSTTNHSFSTIKSAAPSLPEGEAPDLPNLVEECHNVHVGNAELCEKISKLVEDVKTMTAEVKELYLEVKATAKDFPSIAKSAMIDYLKALTTATGNQQKTQSGSTSKGDSDTESSEEAFPFPPSERTVFTDREGATDVKEKEEKARGEKYKEIKKKEEKTKEEKKMEEFIKEEKMKKEQAREVKSIVEKIKGEKAKEETTIEMPSDLRTAAEQCSAAWRPSATIIATSDLSVMMEKAKEAKHDERKAEKGKEMAKITETRYEEKKADNRNDSTQSSAEVIALQKTASSISLAQKSERKVNAYGQSQTYFS